MKKYLKAMVMSFSMFCAIPCPLHIWDEACRPLMTLFLPFVGAFIGALWTLAAYIVGWLSLPALVSGAVLCAFPFLMTGGMHFDGFLDVTDAVKSRRSLEERQKILKDPHVGSFAVLAGVLLLIGQFALFASMKKEVNWFSLIFICVCSRCAAALAVSILKPIGASEYARDYRKGIRKAHIVYYVLLLAAAVGCAFVFLGKYGFVTVGVLAGYALFCAVAAHSLGGMSGDVSGYALTLAELCGVAVLVFI